MTETDVTLAEFVAGVAESPPAAAAKAESTPAAVEPIVAAAEPVVEVAKPSEAELLRERLRVAEKAVEDGKERYLRLAADFDNFKKRAFKERSETAKYAHENLAKQLLDGIDNLERARIHAETADKDALLAGVGIVESIFLQSLERFGIKRFSALGQPFDPAFHEAVQEVVTPDAPPGSVMFELQKGYTYHDRLLRPSRVVLTKAPDKAPEKVSTPDPASVEIDLESDMPEVTGKH